MKLSTPQIYHSHSSNINLQFKSHTSWKPTKRLKSLKKIDNLNQVHKVLFIIYRYFKYHAYAQVMEECSRTVFHAVCFSL